MTKNVLETLRSFEFSFSVEIIPPRNGVDFSRIFEQTRLFSKADFQFISVTHGAGGSLRGGTMPICHFAQNLQDLLSIAHLTCRGQTKEDLENSLIDHHYFDIQNILALRGDPPDGIGATFEKREGGFSYAHELVGLIQNMNQGRYIVRKNYDQNDKGYKEGIPTNFCIGVACYPEDDPDKRIQYLKIKKEKGAQFAITQLIYDLEILKIFVQEVRNSWGDSLPIIPGIRIPYSFRLLNKMKEKFGVNVPENLLRRMEKAEAKSPEMAEKEGIDWAIDFVNEIRSLGLLGVHIFVMDKPSLAIKLKEHFS